MTTSDLEVPVETLRHAAEVLLHHLESVAGSTIRLDTDYFWAVPREQRNDPCSRPSELTIGQLTESLDNVERMVSDPDATLSCGLVWLSDVLRAVGEKVVG